MSYRSVSDRLSCYRASAHAVLQTAPLATWILLHKVWVEGFEPPASCSQSTRATKLRYTQLTTYSVTLARVCLNNLYRLAAS